MGGDFESVEAAQAYIDDPDVDITLTIRGDLSITEFSVKDGYQDAFDAATRSGPGWWWDHDSDGPGDGDSDGFGDWSGPVIFFRYRHPGLTSRVDYFIFNLYDPATTYPSDLITVIVP